MITFPSNLLPTIRKDQYARSFGDGRRFTDQDRAPSKISLKTSNFNENIPMQIFARNINDLLEFENFYKQDCSNGTAVFLLDSPEQSGRRLKLNNGQIIIVSDGSGKYLGRSQTWLCQFGKNTPTIKETGNDTYSVAFEIVRLP